VSHNWLLAVNSQQGTLTGAPRLEMTDFASRRPVDDHCVTRELAPGLESVKASRVFTRMTLRRWEMAEVSDAAELVVSELVTNALRHGLLSARRMPEEHPIRLRLLRQAPYLMCLVTDPGSDVPIRRDSDTCSETGRGLHVVESCSLRWGWQPLDDAGKVVWALMQARKLAVPCRPSGRAA
jgi:anti-sigma regulatory factor (Ser/Thr protein kinase)